MEGYRIIPEYKYDLSKIPDEKMLTYQQLFNRIIFQAGAEFG